VTLFAVGVVALHSIGAPLGEAVADDFDFLHRALLLNRHGFFDGGGSLSFWRPLAHQVYYSLLGETILARPGLIAFLHVTLLSASTLLLYRILRRPWSGPWAAAAATFPLLLESSRELIAWPSHFVDLGSLFFTVLALHEAAFRRMPTALLALLASLLCKETGIVAALLLPWMPTLARASHDSGAAVDSGSGRLPRRLIWAAGTLAVCAVWGLAYLYVRHNSGLHLPHHLESDAGIAATPWLRRAEWALWNSLRAIASLPAVPGPADWIHGSAAAALALATLVGAAASRRARAHLAAASPWMLWGIAWFLLFGIGLTVIYPIWAPYRVVFGALGLGVATTALFGAIHPALLLASIVLRTLAFSVSPGPPSMISGEAPQTGAFLDYGRLVRLQRLMRDTRLALRDRFPTLPVGSRVGQHYFPLQAIYALGGDRALQVWYRDTSVHWLRYEDYEENPPPQLAAIAEFQPHRQPQIVLVEPEAMRALRDAIQSMRRADCTGTISALDRADSLQRDRNAAVFLATVRAKKALCLTRLGRLDDAEREARDAEQLWPENFDSGYALAEVALARGRLEDAERQLIEVLARRPKDRGAKELLDRVRSRRAAETPR
jgi:hypothetical protein